ncbi:DNA cytosine methyltransferase [Lewinella cohaerens]|uniref:DNA cytosine methyltransferase n=1 Tax=Lewinella cohaerens TaxID=70995 RepID=UPI00038212FB|nr:DNA cytosine methyltransferase [Lewinella cohaerens]
MKAIEFYSGVGGFSLGMKRAGFDVKAAFEIDWRHVETYNKNFLGNLSIVQDISNIDFDIDDFGVDCSDLDLVFGGPPCQGFSNGGKQKVDDLRNDQIMKFARLVVQLNPRCFIMENVSGILNKKFSDRLASFSEFLKKNGYTVYDPLVLNAMDFFIPQNRKRVFFIGLKNKIDSIRITAKVRSGFCTDKYVTVRDALCDILDVNLEPNTSDCYNGRFGKSSSYSKKLSNATADDIDITGALNKIQCLTGCMTTNHTPEVVKRFAATTPGNREPISRYKRLALDGLSPTLRAGTKRGMGQFMAPRPIHPVFNRCITTREAARLHSFPDWFVFYPTKWYGMMQIGNSVPPHLSESIGHTIAKILS